MAPCLCFHRSVLAFGGRSVCCLWFGFCWCGRFATFLLMTSPRPQFLCLALLSASRFALSSRFLSLSFRISSLGQPPKLVNLIRFLLPCLWNVSTLSFLLSLLSLILPYPLASFLKFSKLLLLHLSWKKKKQQQTNKRTNLLTRMNWRTIVLSLIFPLSPRLLKNWFFFSSLTTSLPTISTTAFSLPTDPDTVPKLPF